MSDSSNSKWDEVDPRVQWAMDILDWEGAEPTSIFHYYASPVVGAGIGISSVLVTNFANRRPARTNLPVTALLGALGFFAGIKFREFKANRHGEMMAMTKHYIMTNPEKFPEPERKKFGDRLVVLPWVPIR